MALAVALNEHIVIAYVK